MNLRLIAAQAIEAVVNEQQSLNTILPALSEQVTEPRDKALLQELCFGACRYYFYLDQKVSTKLQRPIHRKNALAKSLLIIGAYQIEFTRVPDHAAINECVAACEDTHIQGLKGLVNGVLRNLSRDQSANEAGESKAIDPESNHPDWFVAKLSHNWPDHYSQILSENDHRPPMTLRVNTQKIGREEYISLLEDAGIDSEPCRFSDTGVLLGKALPVDELPNFHQGFCSVQDEAAQLCTALFDLQDGDRVLDACAAPGGKTAALLEQGKKISLIALDADAHRSRMIDENLERIGLQARVAIADANALEDWWDKTPFNHILLDAPCSATGVIRRHPDIKLLRKQEDIKQLAERQLELLETIWQTLAIGGTLVYATCSIFSQENSRIVERFLAKQKNAVLDPIESEWGLDTGFGKQLFPIKTGHDGFFYSRLKKLEDA